MNQQNIKFLDSVVPEFPPEAAAEIARVNYGIEGEFKALYSERDQNYRITRDDGVVVLLKIANSHEDTAVLDMQHQALAHIERQDPELPVPRIIRTRDGALSCDVAGPGGATHQVRLLSYLPGVIIEQVDHSPELLRDLGANVARLGLALRGFYHPAAGHVLLWDLRQAPEMRGNCGGIADETLRAAVEANLDYFAEHIMPRLDGLRAQIIHNDANGSNVLVHDDDHGRIAGIIDYGDMIHGPLILDLAVAVAGVVFRKDDPMAALCDVAAGFDAVTPLDVEELDLLYDLVLTRLAVELLVCAWRVANPTGLAADLEGFVAKAGDAFEQLRAVDRSDARARLRKACKFPPYCPPPGEDASDDQLDDLLERRSQRLGQKLYTFYKRPLHMVRGEGVWLYDASGRAYLDAYNNVPQVGHAHPHVTRAVQRQTASLATNTRYIYEQILDYTDALAATVPGGNAVCVFVNSGSEANDVAWRMAKAFSGNQGALVMEDAYHGATEATDALSPGDRRGNEIAAHVRTLAAPDCYRGEFRGPDAGARYGEDADRAIAELDQAGLGTAAFMLDSGFCTNGILVAPDGYMAAVVDKTRAAGGLFIADEVQSGFGRMGSHMWGYQSYGVEADMITLGKPVGNGYPLGVVITRPEILAAFTERTGYFSTFGGNPVACAAGLAVLEVLEREDLMANAQDAGDYLRDGFCELAERLPLIGNVRGRGLLTGVELVRDRETLEPAKDETVAVMNHMRENGVLVGREGYFGNVLKIRPPLVFNRDGADILIAALGRAVEDVS